MLLSLLYLKIILYCINFTTDTDYASLESCNAYPIYSSHISVTLMTGSICISLYSVDKKLVSLHLSTYCILSNFQLNCGTRWQILLQHIQQSIVVSLYYYFQNNFFDFLYIPSNFFLLLFLCYIFDTQRHFHRH